jgi:hypothetical protein
MVRLLLAFLSLTIAQPQDAARTSASDPKSRLDKEIASKYCRIKFTADNEQDARRLAEYADDSLTSMASKFAPLDAALMDVFSCTILQFTTPQSSLADDSTANAHTEGRGSVIVVSILAASAFSPRSRTAVGEPKDSDYVFNLIANELSTVLFERITRDKGKGWYFHDAPPWFVQGIEGYSGLVNSSKHYRDVTLPKYLGAARAPGQVTFDDGVRVKNPYVGGVGLVAFLYDAYGEAKVNALLTSSAPTFDQAFATTFGDWKAVEAKYRDWVARLAAC